MTELRIRVEGRAQPQGSARAFAFRRRDGRLGANVVTDNPRLYGWRAEVALAARRAIGPGRAVYGGPVEIVAIFDLPRPLKCKRAYPTTRPDLDKLTRGILDALTGIVYVDDAQVIALNVHKSYAQYGPETLIVVRPADERGPQ